MAIYQAEFPLLARIISPKFQETTSNAGAPSMLSERSHLDLNGRGNGTNRPAKGTPRTYRSGFHCFSLKSDFLSRIGIQFKWLGVAMRSRAIIHVMTRVEIDWP